MALVDFDKTLSPLTPHLTASALNFVAISVKLEKWSYIYTTIDSVTGVSDTIHGIINVNELITFKIK